MDTVSKALRGEDDQPSRTALHTPGPWTISGKGTIKAGSRYIGSTTWNNRVANARLIAAAPELYAVLAEVVDTIDYERGAAADPDSQAIATALLIKTRAALLKATGSSDGSDT